MTSGLESDRQLLAEVFGLDAKFVNADFLTWQYSGSPSGAVIASNRDDAEGRVGHYAVLPQRWSVGRVASRFALSLNTAVAERGRGQGLFTTLASETYEAARAANFDAIIGVANAQSTPGFLGKLGFTLVGPLQVSMLPPRPWRSRRQHVERIQLVDVDDHELAGALASSAGVERVWDRAELTWRLSDPTRKFSLFRSDEMLAVTTATKRKGVPVAVILKVLPTSSATQLDLSGLVYAACRHHRALLAMYAGHNPRVSIKGIGLPQRLRPSPLNLIVKSLHPLRPVEELVPTTFEFLEFDAY